MISVLRDNFATDPDNAYYITGAPQCPIPEPNMGIIIGNATFDYLFIQFYNNNNYTYPCALPFNGNAAFNCRYHPGGARTGVAFPMRLLRFQPACFL